MSHTAKQIQSQSGHPLAQIPQPSNTLHEQLQLVHASSAGTSCHTLNNI